MKSHSFLFRNYILKSCLTLTMIAVLVHCTTSTHNPPQSPAEIGSNKQVSTSGTDELPLFYCVYEISPQTVAAIVNLGEKNTKLDSIFNTFNFMDSLLYDLSGPLLHCQYADTTGTYKLHRNSELERQAKNHIPAELFICGTKGISKAKIQNVLFAIDPCRTNFLAFCFDKKEVTSVGHPLIAYTQPMQMEFGVSFDNVEKEINKFYSEIEADYIDTIETRVFARADSLYFAYSDDFSWNGKNASETCLFPMRSVFIVRKNQQIKPYWSDGLDLFGIPCD